MGTTRITLDGSNTVYGEHHYYPFGLEMPGPWKGANAVENDYLYNGKELNKDFSLNLYDYGARMYDVAIGRFTGVDPISDQFPHVSTYNYAENEPIANIDLHGLQKVHFTKAIEQNETFLQAYSANRQTSGGRIFSNTLKSQSKIDVVYTEAVITDGVMDGPVSSDEDINQLIENNPYLQNIDLAEISSFLEDGKSLLIIGTNCFDDCSDESILSTAEDLNHEEVGHGINALKGESKGVIQEHEDYYDEASYYSPDSKDVRSNSKYINSEALKQLKELDKIVNNDKY